MAWERTHEETAGQFSSQDLRLFESGSFSDARIKCGTSTWKVHKAILCQRSEWFDKAFNGTFRESIDGVITIQGFPPDEVEWMLRWLYSGSVAVKDIPGYETAPYPAICNALTVADCFILTELQKMLRVFFWAELSSRIEECQNSKARIISKVSAKRRRIERLTNKTFLDKFFEGVHLLYDGGICEDNPQHPVLRKMMVEFGIRVQSTMLATTGGEPVFVEYLRANPGFAVDMLVEGQGSVPQIIETSRIVCSGCMKVIFRDGRHIARVSRQSGAEDLYTCSACFEKKEKMLEV